MSRASNLKDLEEWAESMDCGWRMEQSEEKPCVHCEKPCNGRSSSGQVAVCYSCYHNVGLCQSAIMCGKPPGYTAKDAAKDALRRRVKQPNAEPTRPLEAAGAPKSTVDSGNGGAE